MKIENGEKIALSEQKIQYAFKSMRLSMNRVRKYYYVNRMKNTVENIQLQ